jgi:hypothetical protein
MEPSTTVEPALSPQREPYTPPKVVRIASSEELLESLGPAWAAPIGSSF